MTNDSSEVFTLMYPVKMFQACFDEFNRIEMDVLSVVAQQIHTIHTAIANKVTTFEFEGAELTLNANCSM